MTYNEKLEKALKGLKCCRDMRNPPGFRFTDCTYCPYNEDEDEDDCIKNLQNDAISLLEALKPKLMTLEEVKQTIRPVFIEHRNHMGQWAIYVDKPRYYNAPLVFVVEFIANGFDSDRLGYSISEYGKTWRCWTDWPTYEETEMVKWND